jgi:hypothetical protein
VALTFLSEAAPCSEGWIAVGAIGAGVLTAVLGIALIHWRSMLQGEAMLRELRDLNLIRKAMAEDPEWKPFTKEPKP